MGFLLKLFIEMDSNCDSFLSLYVKHKMAPQTQISILASILKI